MENIIKDFSSGKPVIIMNEAENSGNIVFPGEYIQYQYILDMYSYSSGLIYVIMTESRACKIGLKKMNDITEEPYSLITVDDKVKYIREIVFGESKTFMKESNIIPLICKNGLLEEKRGISEASIQLCMLSSVNLVAITCELLNSDKKSMGLAECSVLSETFNIPLVNIKDIDDYSKKVNFKNSLKSSLTYTECSLQIKNYVDPFKLRIYKDNFTNEEISILYKGTICTETILRLQKEYNVFNSSKYNEKLQKAMDTIYKKGGMIMYVKDYDLFNKIKIQNLKEQGEFSFFKNEDNTDYSFCIRILKEMGIKYIDLISNDKSKVNIFKGKFKVKLLEENEEITYILTPSKEHYFNINKEIVYNKTVNIVSTIFNKNLVLKILKKIYSKLGEYNVKIILHEVPGIYEIPIACQKLTNGFNKSNIIIAVGVSNKDIESVNKSLMEVQLKNDIIIINGIISYSTEEQLEFELNSTTSEDLALSALHMIQEHFPSEIKKSIFRVDNSHKTFFN